MTTAHLPEKQILAEIRPIGLSAEKAMFEATNGINTHKEPFFPSAWCVLQWGVY